MTFPIHMLPTATRDAIEAQAALGNYPIESVGTAALAVMSYAVQGLFNIDSLQRPGVSYPLSQLFMILSPSGDAKSSIFKQLMTGVTDFQTCMGRAFDEDVERYGVEFRAFEKRRAMMDKDKNATPEDRFALEKDKPRYPKSPWNTPSKVTTNGIFKYLETGYPTYGIFSGEGGSLLAGHSLRQENSPAEFASALTTLWDGDTVDRATGDVTMRLRGRRLSGLLMVQPEVASAFLTHPTLRVHGIHARFLLVSPPAWQPTAEDFTDPRVIVKRSALMDRLQQFTDQVRGHLHQPYETSDDYGRELNPPVLEWSQAAAKHMVKFQDRALEHRQEEETFFKRTFEHACRLAGVLAAFENHTKVSLADAEAATALVEFYADEWRKLDVGVADERDTRLSGYIDKVEKHLRRGPATAREIARGPLQRVDLKVREQVLASMLSDGVIAADEIETGTTKTISYRIA